MWTHPWPFDRQGGPSYDFEPRERKRFQHERCALLGSPPDGDCIGCVDIGRHWLLVEGAGPFIVVDWSCYQVQLVSHLLLTESDLLQHDHPQLWS